MEAIENKKKPYHYKGRDFEIQHSPEEINAKLQTILDSGRNFDKDFQFRPGQRKAIIRIAFLYLNNLCKNVILDAPTGSGKSIIAIMTARLLREWKKEGYMITSNLDLQDQYMKDINNCNLMWGSVKGVDNYTCDVNGLSYSLGECKSRGYSKEKVEALPCYTGCGYLMSKLRAANSAIAVLNYSYWLIQRNYVAKQKSSNGKGINEASQYYDESFKVRDFCFFDEAHRIDDIVQSHFSLNLTDNVLQKILDHVEYINTHNMVKDNYILDVTKICLEWTGLMTEYDYDSNVKSLRFINKVIHELALTREVLQHEVSKYTFGQGSIPIYLRQALKRCELFKDVGCKLSDYLEIIEKDPECFVKTCDENENAGRGAVFNLLKDQLLLKDKLHDQSNFSVFMSATFGNPDVWAEMCGVDDYEVISIPNQWNFDQSPIFLSKNLPSLSYANRDANISTILAAMDDILDKHDCRGIVHSANFHFTKYIMQHSRHKKRMFSYENSKERAGSIEKLKNSENGILVGPSLTEGLDLKDDHSRLQIFFKVPFRVVTDNYTKRRMEYDKKWYGWKTMLAFVQALGRSVRNENDWAVTYLLDGNFRDFIRYNFNMIPKHIETRIKFF